MYITRRFVIVFSIIIASVSLRAQWLTKADESQSTRSARVNRHENLGAGGENSEVEADDPGVGDAFKWYWRQRTFGLGYIPQGALQKAAQQRDAMRNGKGMTTLSAQPAWSLIGPTNIGGRVNDIAINPYNPHTVFIAAANGGVWKTEDAGAQWTPLTDQMQSVSMGSLAIDPNDTNTVFAGTGELPDGIDAYGGYGLLRSTNGGASWADVGPSSVAAYSRVIVNPHHSNLVYAAAGRAGGGVLRSSDGGNSWNWLAGGLPQDASVTDLALSMNGDVAVLYAGIASHGVFQSMDGGDTWTELFPFTVIGLDSTAMDRIALDADPKNWQNVVALDVNFNSGSGQDDLGGMVVSNDGGNSWTEIDQEWQSEPLFSVGSPPQGWYDVYVRVDPTNFNHMLVGGLSVWQSNDAGQSWEDVALSYRGGIHPDQHAAAFSLSNPSIVFLGNDGGIFSSDDGGSTITPLTYPIPITQFYGIGIDQTQANVTYGGTQDNGTLSGANVSQDNWGGILGGDGTYTLVDPKSPSIVYCANPGGDGQPYPSISTNGGGAVNSTNGINPLIDSLTWLNPFAADATNDIVYWGCQRLTYTKNQGSSWVNCSQNFGSAYQSTTITCIDAFGDGKTVLVGTGGGNVYLTTNNGTSFTDVSSNLPGRAVTWVKFNPSSKTTFYATFSGFGAGHVFETTNSGALWTDISTRLPDIPVNTLLMDPQNSSVLYIGTDVGLFFSPNDGGEWMPYGTGLPNTGIDFMAIQIANRELRAGTHGRSIWQVSLVDDVTGIVFPAQRSVWTVGDTASIQWHGFASPVTLDLSTDGGTTWQNIAPAAGDTIYSIPSVAYATTENAIVRVSDGTNTLLSPLFSIAQQKAGSDIGTVADTRFYGYDLAYDKDDNVLWVTNFEAAEDYIFELDPDAGTVLDSVKIPVTNSRYRLGFTGIKYDPTSKNLFLQEVTATDASETAWTSMIYEVTTAGKIVKSLSSPAAYGTGIYLKGDTLFVVDRAVNQIQMATLPNLNFNIMNPLDFSDTRSSIYGPRGLTYDPLLGEFLLAYTNFQGAATPMLNGSYMLFLNPDASPVEQNAFSIVDGDNTNVRGMEYDPRGAGNSAWMTVLDQTGSTSQIIKVALADGPTSASIASLTLVPSVIAFGNLDTGKSNTIPAELHNSGNTAVTITAISILPAGSPFSLGAITLPVTLPPGDSLPVSVTFAPHTQGSQGASLSVTYGSENQQISFPITGFATVNGSGVAQNAAPNGWGIELNPNPASNFVDVTLDASVADIAQLRIYDVTGREVLTTPLGMLSPGEHETELSTSDLPDGIYFVRVTGSKGQVASTRLSIVR